MSKKNVILLHADQQRFDSLGCNGNRFARTPNLDQLAAGGTIFTRHIASNPICSPSRASLLTGLYPPGHNLWCNGIALNRQEYARYDTRNEHGSGDARRGFHPAPATIADCFAQAGYRTAAFGKLHLTPYLADDDLGYPECFNRWMCNVPDDWNQPYTEVHPVVNDWHGPYYGFQHVEMVLGHGEWPCFAGHYAQWLQSEHPDVFLQVNPQLAPRPRPDLYDLYPTPVPFALHNSCWLADRLCDYIGSAHNAGDPFFAFVGFPDPHHPFSPCSDILPDFLDIPVPDPQDAGGGGQEGSPVRRLNQQRLGDISRETIRLATRYTYAMVYQIDLAVGRILEALDRAGLADDTIVAFTSDHGDYLGDHDCLRKGFGASDSLVHVPFVLRAPGGGLPARVDTPMSNCDVLPTLAGLAGVEPPAWQHGEDMARICREGLPHEAFVFSANGDPDATNHTVYDDRYRLSWYPQEDFVELFDHLDDPGECRNLAGDPAQRERIAALKRRIADELAACYSPMLGRVAAW